MRNDNYLSLINFKVKLHRHKLFFKFFEPPTSCLFIKKKKTLTMKFNFEIN